MKSNRRTRECDQTERHDSWEIIIAETEEDIEKIRPVWEEMQSNEPYPVVNADIDRYLSVVKACSDDVQPYVVLMKQNGHPIAMIIGRFENHQIKLQLGYKTLFRPSLRCLTVVYGGILGQLTGGIYAVVIRLLLDVLRHGEVDVVYLSHVRADSHIYQLSRKIPGVLTRDYFLKVEPHLTMLVPENITQFYQARSRKHRGNLKRNIRNLARTFPEQVKMSMYTRQDELDEAIRAVSCISSKTYQHAIGCGFADDYRTRTLLTTVAKQGWLCISVLYIDSEAAAFQIGLHYHKKYFLEQIGFDPKWSQFNIGTVLFLKVLEDICADPSIEFIDFGFGCAEYKQSYGNEQWREASVYIFAPRLYSIFVNMLRSSIMGLDMGLRYAFQKFRYAGWIKRRWRNLLQKGDKH